MALRNVEIKARCHNHELLRSYLKEHGAEYSGLDHQVDTYFVVSGGRLKLRQGNVENNLIFYDRGNQSGQKSGQLYGD